MKISNIVSVIIYWYVPTRIVYLYNFINFLMSRKQKLIQGGILGVISTRVLENKTKLFMF